MSSYHSGETIFNAKKVIEASNGELGYYKKFTWQERLIAANYLNSIKYNHPENEPPKLDRTFFKIHNQEERDRDEL